MFAIVQSKTANVWLFRFHKQQVTKFQSIYRHSKQKAVKWLRHCFMAVFLVIVSYLLERFSSPGTFGLYIALDPDNTLL